MDTNLIQYIFGKVSLLEVNRGVPKRLRDRSAKPSFTGSTPVSASYPGFIAQRIEHPSPEREIMGSSPIGPT